MSTYEVCILHTTVDALGTHFYFATASGKQWATEPEAREFAEQRARETGKVYAVFPITRERPTHITSEYWRTRISSRSKFVPYPPEPAQTW
jgi:hypothetical protein